MCLYACAIFRKPLCILIYICIYIHMYIYVYVNIYKHLPLYSYVHLRLEMIYPKGPRIASNGKKCSRALFSTLFAKNQVFWKQSCFFQSKGLPGTWKSLKVSEIVGFPAMWFWLLILSDSYWFFPILTDWFLSCHVLPQRWNMIKNAEIIRNTISSRGSRNLCLFPAAGVWGQCRKANPLRSLGQTTHLFRG